MIDVCVTYEFGSGCALCRLQQLGMNSTLENEATLIDFNISITKTLFEYTLLST